MRKSGSMAVVFCVMNVLSFMAFADIANGLVAYYPFSGNANDASGNGHHGTANGPILTEDVKGTPNNAYEFDGIDDGILIPHDEAFNFGTGAFSLSAWILNTNTLGSPFKRILTKRFNAAGWYSLLLVIDQLLFEKGGPDYQSLGPEIQGDGKWHHVAAVRESDGSTILYVDGVGYSPAVTPPLTDVDNLGDLEIGKWVTEAYDGETFRGKIDEVRIYSRALPAEDIEILSGTHSIAALLNPPDSPESPASAMHSIEDLYQYLNTGVEQPKRPDGFKEPTGTPGNSGRTLDEVYALLNGIYMPEFTRNDVKCGDTLFGFEGISGPLPKIECVKLTGQTDSYMAGDDGAYQNGCEPVTPFGSSFGYSRASFEYADCIEAGFTDNGDGTVTDKLTGLIWLKIATCDGGKYWADALAYCNNLASGTCGLSDGSQAGDWRLPNLNELRSLVDRSTDPPPKLPAGHPFSDVYSDYYWTSTTYALLPSSGYIVHFNNGGSTASDKASNAYYVWPVRGGD